MIEVIGLTLQMAGVVTLLLALVSRRKEPAVMSRDKVSRLSQGCSQAGRRLKFLLGGVIWYSLLVVAYSGIILPADVRMQTPMVSPTIWQAMAEAGISMALAFPMTVAGTALIIANTSIPLNHDSILRLQPRKILATIIESSVAVMGHFFLLFGAIAPLFVLVTNLFRIDEIGLRMALGPLFISLGSLGVLTISILLFPKRRAENLKRLRLATIFAYQNVGHTTGEFVLRVALPICRYLILRWTFTLDYVQRRIRTVLVFAILTILVGLLLELSSLLLTG